MNEFDTAEDVTYIVTDTWGAYLSEDVTPSPTTATERDVLTGEVRIEGAWNGAVRLTMDLPLAEQVASTLLDVGPCDYNNPEDAVDIRDAVGELANIVAGNIKGIAPQPSTLTLPTVTHQPAWAPAPNSNVYTYQTTGQHTLHVEVGAD